MATARRGEDGYQDGYEETKAKLAYLARGDQVVEPPKADTYRECRVCGQTGYVGAYPFSTLYSPNRRCVCDDCC